MPRYTYGLVAVCIAHLLSGCGGGGGGGLAVSDVPVVEEEGRFDVNDLGARTYALNEGSSDSTDSLEPSDFETDEYLGNAFGDAPLCSAVQLCLCAWLDG